MAGSHGRGVPAVGDGWDDEELLTALRRAIGARQAVPPEFVAAGQNAFAWRNIDAELAQLSYDSARDAALTRTEPASVRALTFTSAHLTIELEVTGDSLLGQLVPVQSAVIEVQASAGAHVEVASDEIGCFSIRPVPAGPFRLRCRAAGLDVLTGWFTV